MLNSVKQVINFVSEGLVLGYKPCCIKYFTVRLVNGDLQRDMLASRLGFPGSERLVKKLTGTGFICCAECNEKYSEEELITDINSRRIYPVPFPSEEDDVLTDGYRKILLEDPNTYIIVSETIKEVSQFTTLRS